MLLRHSPANAPVQAGRATRAAFTLLEVLVVVAIIVMLAGIGGYYLLQRYEDAKVSTAKAECNALSSQVEIYKLNNGEYPASIQALTQQQPNGHSPMIPAEKALDPWGKPYQIDPAGQHNAGGKADVFTTTPNGQIVGNFPSAK
jgi:general secretion pathway protein G